MIHDFNSFMNESERLILEFAAKDKNRIEDIKTKAGGDETKMVRLATTMANSITDKHKAFDRGAAADAVLGPGSAVAQVFYDRAKELGIDVEVKKTHQHVLPGSKRHDAIRTHRTLYNRGGRGCPILPCGKLNLQTGTNKYFNIHDKDQIDSTIEVWKISRAKFSSLDDEDKDEYRLVITAGSRPICGIGQKEMFCHDQSGSPLFYGEMVDYIEAEFSAQLIPLYGKTHSSYVYK